MKAREILLLLLIVGLGVFTYYAKTGKLNIEWDSGDFVFFGRGEEFLFQESREIPAPLPRELQVINSHGGVVVRGTETDKITIVFTKTVYRRTRDAAQTVADQLKMAVNRDESKLVLSTNRDTFKRKNFETHFEITVPKGFEVKVKNSYLLVKAVGTGLTDIANPHGQVEAMDIAGPLVVNNSYEDVSILNAGADCRVTSPHGKVTAIGVQGELIIDHSYGDVEIENIAKKAVVKGSHSRVTGKNLKAEVEIESSYEPISVTDSGPTTIRGHHSDIEARGIAGPLSITDNYARLVVDGVKGDLRIDGTNMEIRAESVAADEIRIATTNQNVEILGFTGKTTVRLDHGDLVLEPEAVTGPIDVQASYAAIRFGWPAGGRFPFEGRTRSANILWNLAERPSLEETNGLSLTKAFQDETGKPSITLSTSYADIRVVETRRPIKTI
jgi:hypothetical protein